MPDDLPFLTGSPGLLGTKPSWDPMKQYDTLPMVGSRSPTANACQAGDARGVQIDIDGAIVSLRLTAMTSSLKQDQYRTL